jgi:hypothetical protein
MRPKFDEELQLHPSRRRLMACGPIDWEEDDESAIFFAEIEQEQNGTPVLGSGGPSDRFVNPGSQDDIVANDWMVPVRVRRPLNAQFDRGPVTVARGRAIIQKTDGRQVDRPWEHPPEAPDVRLVL